MKTKFRPMTEDDLAALRAANAATFPALLPGVTWHDGHEWKYVRFKETMRSMGFSWTDMGTWYLGEAACLCGAAAAFANYKGVIRVMADWHEVSPASIEAAMRRAVGRALDRIEDCCEIAYAWARIAGENGDTHNFAMVCAIAAEVWQRCEPNT